MILKNSKSNSNQSMPPPSMLPPEKSKPSTVWQLLPDQPDLDSTPSNSSNHSYTPKDTREFVTKTPDTRRRSPRDRSPREWRRDDRHENRSYDNRDQNDRGYNNDWRNKRDSYSPRGRGRGRGGFRSRGRGGYRDDYRRR